MSTANRVKELRSQAERAIRDAMSEMDDALAAVGEFDVEVFVNGDEVMRKVIAWGQAAGADPFELVTTLAGEHANEAEVIRQIAIGEKTVSL